MFCPTTFDFPSHRSPDPQPRPASGAPPSCAAAPIENLCYHGQNLKYMKTTSAKECCSACATQKNCTTYQFQADDGVCKLYDPSARHHPGGCQTGSSTDVQPVLPALVQNEFGPYCDGINEQLSVEYPFISGYTTASCKWKAVEEQKGVFNWTQCRNDIEFAHAHVLPCRCLLRPLA